MATLFRITITLAVLGLTLGYQASGQEAIRGLPCIQRLHQLFCRNQGNTYPNERIESFIDLNKALTIRMFGEFQAPELPARIKRSSSLFNNTMEEEVEEQEEGPPTGHRRRRQSSRRFSAASRQAIPAPPKIDKGSKHLVDSCESRIEITTPFWAANSAGEIRAIVNTKHFPQAIHQEICKGTKTSRCSGDCTCEQKYTYHRLLAYDPENDCKGIFIDWFLFPSCCACRCPP
ncbi:Protein spaetzle 3 [Amphibalanus amphitrite]|uniref:Protein spaetzle 3 n=2 Tax=Amphibalanus amphitrite TaxID=1232801 RepID=A0A6A4WBR3_AMPAM|nr:Protein spaetzle 3 [Amphibalanus amphitrite]